MKTRQFQSVGSRRPIPIRAISVLVMIGLIRATGQVATFTDRSTFSTFLTSSRTIDFESLPPYDGIGTGQSPITVSSGTFPFGTILTVTNYEQRLFVAGNNSPIPGTGQYLWNFDSSYPIGIFFPGGGNAFAADLSGGIVQNNPFNATLTFTLAGGQTYTHNFTSQMGEWTFRGFIFAQAIDSVVYDDGGPFLPGAHEEKIDNVTYGFGAVVPEPDLVTFGFGLAAASLLIRKRLVRSPLGMVRDQADIFDSRRALVRGNHCSVNKRPV